jgi:hypothetical protein
MSKDQLATKTASTAVALSSSFADDASLGFENADRDSYALPFLQVLQSGSPQVKRSEGAYIKGAEEGMLYDTINGTIFDGDAGISVVPVYFERSFNEWAPRESGGGYRGRHEVSAAELMRPTRNEKGQDILANGNLLVDTRNHYVLIIQGQSYTPAIISFSSTQIKKSKRWLTMMSSLKMPRADGSLFTPPTFSHQYAITTVPESNDKGSWFGWKIENAGVVEVASVYEAAKELRRAIMAGEAKAAEPVEDDPFN